MLRENKVLTSLRLWGCELGPGDLCAVLSAVGMNTTLTSLDLSLNKFDDQSIASLGKLLIIHNNQYVVSGNCTCRTDDIGVGIYIHIYVDG